MIKLFYGQDIYSLNCELKEIEKEFFDPNMGDINISRFDASGLTPEFLIRSASAIPFFSDKRLVIVKNFLLESKDEKFRDYIFESLNKFPDSLVLIFAEEGQPNKTTKLFKKLAKLPGSKEFPLRVGFELEKWLSEYGKSIGTTIAIPATKALISAVGNNSHRLINEVDKLTTYVHSQGRDQIEVADVEEMVAYENDPNIFDFIDALGNRNGRIAFKIFNDLIQSGKNENYILTMIVYQFRNMLLVQDLISRGVQKPKIASEASLHPFVVTKTINVLRSYDMPTLKRIYGRLLQTDIDIKTGRLEAKLALEKLLADLVL